MVKKSKNTPKKEAQAKEVLEDYLSPILDVVSARFADDENVQFMTEVALSAVATLLIENVPSAVGVIFEGQAGSNKTVVLDFLDDMKELVFKTDEWTAASWVTNVNNKSDDQKAQIHMLPKVKNKVFVTPDLAPMFAKGQHDSIKNLGQMTRIMDGEGLIRSAGTTGTVEISGDYRFTLLGATTPIGKTGYISMGKVGNRFLIVDSAQYTRKVEQIVAQRSGGNIRDKKAECKAIVKEQIQKLWKDVGGVRKVTWDEDSEDLELRIMIAECAQISAMGRSYIEEDIRHQEDPMRLTGLLSALAWGRALLCGRRKINRDDVAMVARVAMDTMPYNHRRLFRMLLCAPLGKPEVYSKSVDEEMGVVRDTSLQRMDALIETGLAEPVMSESYMRDAEPTRVGIKLTNKIREKFLSAKAKNRWAFARIPNFTYVDKAS